MADNKNTGGELVIKSEIDLKNFIAKNYMNQIKNFFASESQAMRFMSSMMASVQRNQVLLQCVPMTIINSFMTMAQLGLMPSNVSGEAFVLPYKNKGVLEAQFQLGYQGLVTLLYRAGAKSIVAELVRKNDVFRIVNNSIHHEVDPFKSKAERGEAVGAYAIITIATGGKVERFMRMDEIMQHAKKYSKSFDSDFSPWNPESDLEAWMPRKTVLKQAAKLAPKNEQLVIAIAEDNKDSRISEVKGMVEDNSLQMGKFLKPANDKKTKAEEGQQTQNSPVQNAGSDEPEIQLD